MSAPCKTWLVSGGVYQVYALKIVASSEGEAVEIAKQRFLESAWEGWESCGGDGDVLIQGEGEALSWAGCMSPTVKTVSPTGG